MSVNKIIGIIFLIVLLSEFTMRTRNRNWIFGQDPSKRPTSSRFYDFRKIKNIEPHIDCDYLTQEFWDEMQNLTRERSGLKMVNSQGEKYLVAKNCPGKFFSVNDNLRTTLFSPNFSTRNCFLFGSSPLHNFEVPDSLTTASNLQKLFSASDIDVTVHNYGVSGATLENNFARILEIETLFNGGDVIIVLFGINDVGLDTYPMSEMKILKVIRKLGEYSLFFRTIHRQFARPSWKKHARRTVRKKLRLLENIFSWSISRNIGFRAILEPVLYQKRNLNNYETNLRKSFGQKLEYLYRFGYEEFLTGLNPTFTSSMIHVFDRTSRSVFLDYAHINAVGTEILAAEIFDLTASSL